MKEMIKSMKVRLLPNNKQKTALFQCAEAFRYTYNWALRKERESFKKEQRYLLVEELKERFDVLKTVEAYHWLLTISEDIMEQAIKEAAYAYKNFIEGVTNCPRFKQKGNTPIVFCKEKEQIQITDTHMVIKELFFSRKKERQSRNQIKRVQTKAILGNDWNRRIRFLYDGNDWYATVEVIVPEQEVFEKNESSTTKEQVSDDRNKITTVCRMKSTCLETEPQRRIKRLKKRRRRIQRSIARKYEKNRIGDVNGKTRNMVKKEKELQKLNTRLTNMQRLI